MPRSADSHGGKNAAQLGVVLLPGKQMEPGFGFFGEPLGAVISRGNL